MHVVRFAALLFVATAARAQTPAATWDSVARILEAPATPSAGYTRFNIPRRDLVHRIGDVTVAPALLSTTWAGFAGTPSDAETMGDIVMTAGEVPGVTAELAREGIDLMALHNHAAGDVPALTYAHFHARGGLVDLATRVDRVLARTAAPRPVAAAPAVPLAIDTGRVFAALGAAGRAQGALAQVGLMFVPGTVTMDGHPLVPAMAYGTPISIQMVDATRAVAAGDFTVPPEKVQGVVTALAASGITATALHTHLVGESPRVYYIHFWADGPLDGVLAGLRRAIEAAR